MEQLKGQRCRCGACGELFNSTWAFDRHRQGEYSLDANTRKCLAPMEMERAGWNLAAGKFWMTPKRSDSTLTHRRNSGDEENSKQVA